MPAPTERPLTPAESALVDQARAAALERHAQLQGSPWELAAPGLIVVLIGTALWAAGFGFGPFLAVPGLLMCLGGVAAKVKNSRTVPAPGPHDHASRALEFSLTARRVVYLIDKRGDGQLYALMEQPDGRWHLLVDEMLAMDDDLITILAHERVRWSETETGLPLRVWGEGASIPRRGLASFDEPDVQTAIDAGFVWSPDDLDGDTVEAHQLPAWIRDWSLPPSPPVWD